MRIDTQTGSVKLLEYFKPEEVEPCILPAGDIAFFGNGPEDNVWYIGIEYKKLDDVVQCIKSGRLTGTQLPKMLALYDICFLLVEGIPRPHPETGQLLRYMGKSSVPMGLSYREYDNFLTSIGVFTALSGKPCIVKYSGQIRETINIIWDLYHYFQKPWDEHTSMRQPDRTKAERSVISFSFAEEPKPGHPDYSKHILRKSIYQIDRMGWKSAGDLAEKCGTMENLMGLTQKGLQYYGLGPVMADRVFRALHGYQDPNVETKKRKKMGSKQL